MVETKEKLQMEILKLQRDLLKMKVRAIKNCRKLYMMKEGKDGKV